MSDCSYLTARSAFYFAGGDATSARLDFNNAIVCLNTHDLKIRLPSTARFVIGVGNVVAEGNALSAAVATVAIDGHGTLPQLSMSSIRAISAPSPLR